LINQQRLIYQEDLMTQSEGTPEAQPCCDRLKVQALVNIDDRGQMVLPKDVRDKAGIRGGDKLALTTIERDGRVCCLLLTRADDLVQIVQSTLGPVAKDLISPDADRRRGS
jgi:antitoxin PrlF